MNESSQTPKSFYILLVSIEILLHCACTFGVMLYLFIEHQDYMLSAILIMGFFFTTIGALINKIMSSTINHQH